MSATTASEENIVYNFSQLKFDKYPLGGVISRFVFPNKFGCSVVQHPYSLGGKMELYELAVLDFNGNISYTTSITDDVIGYLDENQVSELMNRISKLNQNGNEI